MFLEDPQRGQIPLIQGSDIKVHIFSLFLNSLLILDTLKAQSTNSKHIRVRNTLLLFFLFGLEIAAVDLVDLQDDERTVGVGDLFRLPLKHLEIFFSPFCKVFVRKCRRCRRK